MNDDVETFAIRILHTLHEYGNTIVLELKNLQNENSPDEKSVFLSGKLNATSEITLTLMQLLEKTLNDHQK